MAAGAVTVPAYTTNTSEDYRHVLANSGAKAVIVSTAALAQRLLPAADQVSSYLTAIIALEPLKTASSPTPRFMNGTRCLRAAPAHPDEIDAQWPPR